MRKGWDYKKLGEVCAPKTDILRANKLFHKDDVIEYIDISSIDNCAHSITQPTRFLFYEAPSRAQQKVEQGDILYSLVRPNLKNIAVVTSSDTDKYVASSGFCVLRSKEVDHRYLYHLVLSNPFNDYIMGLVSGANYPAVREDDIKGFSFRCPPIADQQRIVAELDKINELISLKKAQLSDLDTLAQSIFYEMFGDPIENEKGWPVKRLGEVCETITDGDHMPPPKSDNGVPFITISDINKDTRELDFSNTFYVPTSYYDALKEDRKAKKGDLLYTVTGSYGIPLIVKTDLPFCFQRHIALIRPNREVLLTTFLCSWALCPSVKYEADRVATGIAQKTVGLNSIRKFCIPLPPLSLQQSFARKIEAIEQQKAQITATIKDLETLLASRMQYWFD